MGHMLLFFAIIPLGTIIITGVLCNLEKVMSVVGSRYRDFRVLRGLGVYGSTSYFGH